MDESQRVINIVPVHGQARILTRCDLIDDGAPVIFQINADDILELDTTDESRLEYVRKQGLRFVNANLDQPARKAFGTVNLYPTLFFVKKDGTIYRHLVNFQSKEKLTAIIEEMLSSS